LLEGNLQRDVNRGSATQNAPAAVLSAKGHPLFIGTLIVLPPFLTAALQLLLSPSIQPYVWILFYPAIFLSSFFGGIKGGVISTALAALLVVYLFIPPEFSFAIQNFWILVPVGVFLATGILFSVMHERLRKVGQEATSAMVAALHANEARHKQSEVRFRALIENSTDGIALIDPDNKILYLSPGVTAIEGYTPEEMLSRTGLEHTHPDDIPKIQATVEQLLANPGKSISVLWRRRHKNGHWLWLEGVATNLLAEPAVKAIVTNYRNVTNRVVHEEKIRVQLEHLRLLDHITRAVAERQDLISIFQVAVRSLEEGLPIDFGCVMIYDPAVKMLRVTCVGVKSAELAHELMLDEQAAIDIDKNGMESCLQGKLVYEPDTDQMQFPFPERLARGGLGSIVMAPLRSESHVFGMLVTARKEKAAFTSSECEFLRQLSEHIGLASRQTQLNIALQQAYDDLRQSQEVMMEEERLRALGQMASGIAHDINNALTPVLLYADTILETEDMLGEESRGYLETIKRSVEDVAHTVARLREFYRQRDDDLKLVPVQMNDIVRQIVDLTRARWSDMPQQRGVVIKVTKELAEDLPKVWGVESEMREALTNLVFNAVDAMPDGGNLVVRTQLAGNTENPLVHVEVSDDGIGMDEETRKRCLEPFFTTKGERGTGLGLAMVFGIVQRHGAGFEVESTLGEGTTVRLVFAVPPVPLQDTAPPSIAPQPQAKLRILAIDDDPILLRSLRNALEVDGHFVLTADSGESGITTFCAMHERNEPFDIVITDLGMPYMDGRQIAAMVKQVSATPVILLTGWGQRLISEGDIPLHVDRVLAKPPRLTELRQTLTQLCPNPAAQHVDE
jgi:PAS domain S-box-containing protein